MTANAALTKAQLTPADNGEGLKFSFNPSEYTIAKSATWNRPTTKGAKKAGRPEFQGANAQTLQMEIFLDGYPSGEVARSVGTLLSWVRPTAASLNKNKPEPPILTFHWGVNPALEGFQAYLKSVSAKYTMFDTHGTPTRATANITLEEAPENPKKQGQNPTSRSIHGRSVHVLREGESLTSIAYDEYGDAHIWRGLAAFNGIDDPLRIVPGTRILVPTLSEALKLA
jgi:Contractile injection system tube protein